MLSSDDKTLGKIVIGACDGNIDGSIDRVADGNVLGCSSVGIKDGIPVGLSSAAAGSVGFCVAKLGEADGDSDGAVLTVGGKDGVDEGLVDGATLSVGVDEGLRDGTKLG